MKTILLAAALGFALQSDGCDGAGVAKPAPAPLEDRQTEAFFRERSTEEMRRLFATEQRQFITGCRSVRVVRDGDYIVLLETGDSNESPLGSVHVSAEGGVVSNSLPANLTFDQLMELTRKAQFVSVSEWRQVCGKEVAR